MPRMSTSIAVTAASMIPLVTLNPLVQRDRVLLEGIGIFSTLSI